MVSTAQNRVVPGALDRTYAEVKESIRIQHEQLVEDAPRPKRLTHKNTYIFRTRPGLILRPVITFDLPDSSWLSPADQFGRIKLNNYMRRTNVPVPGVSINWGKLNRIAAARHGNRDVVFTSEPRTKEGYFPTNDPYIAAVIREHIRMANDPTHKRHGNELRYYYEVNRARYIMVGEHRFEDDDMGRAEAFAFGEASGIHDIKLVIGNPLSEETDVPFVDDQDNPFGGQGMTVEAALEILQDTVADPSHFDINLTQDVSRETPAPAEKIAVPSAKEAIQQVKQARGRSNKKTVADLVPDPIETFNTAMDQKMTPDFAVPTDTAPAFVMPDSDIVAVNQDDGGSIDDLIEGFVELNGGEQQDRTNPEDLG